MIFVFIYCIFIFMFAWLLSDVAVWLCCCLVFLLASPQTLFVNAVFKGECTHGGVMATPRDLVLAGRRLHSAVVWRTKTNSLWAKHRLCLWDSFLGPFASVNNRKWPLRHIWSVREILLLLSVAFVSANCVTTKKKSCAMQLSEILSQRENKM